MIRIHVYDEHEELHREAARVVLQRVAERPGLVLGVATGSSPLGLYGQLAEAVARGDADLSGMRAFALDEYVGLARSDPRGYRSVIHEQVVEPLRLEPSSVSVPDGSHPDPHAAAADYEASIAAAGGVDLQILGIGRNGHIGFNEPTSSLASRTRIKTLAAATRQANARFFAETDGASVPTHCLTQGLGTILDAGALVLVAQGERKAEAIRQAVEGPLSSRWPASALQLHRRATVIVDEAAASRLELADYYRETFAAKPDWQRA